MFIKFAIAILFTFQFNFAIANDGFNSMNIDQLYDSDQADRVNHGEINWDSVISKDEQRKHRVLELLKTNAIINAKDFWKASIIMQHGQEIDDYKIAYSFANIYYEKSPAVKREYWIVAATWDRLMLESKLPQWYGTQFYKSKSGNFELLEIDRTKVSDDQRKRLGLKTLPEIEKDLINFGKRQ